jgi:uncharacterized protein (TIGR02217 family)
LVAAVEDEAGAAPFTSHILVYLPTVLDPLAPEAKRANVPIDWAAPAFDVLQLEDYDWVTSGNHGAINRAMPLMLSRLGYPIAEQHYFSGFVLRPEGKAQWREIAFACDAARERGTAQAYVWALPQVARDGFTYFRIANESEDHVQPFDDVAFPIEIGREAEVTAEFSTNVVTMMSGHERRNTDWVDARMSYDVAPGIRSEAELASLITFFRARRGAAIGFRFGDPFDDSSNGANGTPTVTDQLIGTGNGIQTEYFLVKHYGSGAGAQARRITRPRTGSVLVAINGTPASGWALADKGKIIFENAPASGSQVTAGFRFDVPVRFAEDLLNVSRSNFAAGNLPSVPLIEIKEAA